LLNALPKMLFFANEAGSAAYLAPLWRRWIERGYDRLRWCVVLGEGAKSWVELHGPKGLPLADITAPMALEELISFVAAWRPESVVASATGYRLEAELVALAKEQGIYSAQLVDNWYGYRSRFELDGVIVLPDRILLIDQYALSEAVNESLPRARLTIVGQPAWEREYIYPEAEPSCVLFVTQPVRRHYGKQLGYDELDAWNLLMDFKKEFPERIDRLILAQHPAGSLLDSVELVDVEACVDGFSVLGEVGTVLGMFSSMMVDALLAGRNVLSLQPGNRGRDMSPLSRRGNIHRIGTVNSLNKVFDEKPKGLGELRAVLNGSLERLERVFVI